MAVVSAGQGKRIAALLAVALVILAPALWIGWSLYAASLVEDSNRAQRDMLAALRTRLDGLAPGENSGAVDPQSMFLPGETPAIAGAALQRLVAATIETAGGRVTESEISPVEAEGDPGRVELRASFDTEIVGLQKILFELESGAPILLLRTLDVQSGDVASGAPSPALRVVMEIAGRWEAEE
jgi:hypothetical protein